MIDPTLEGALEPLRAGYRTLLDAFLAAIENDDRIRAAWLSGSVARGVADAGSDLDLIVTVQDGALERFSADWRGWLAGWADAIIAGELPGIPGSFYATTRDGLRVDVVAESVSAHCETQHRIRIPILDRDAIADGLPAPDHDARLPDVAKLEETIEDVSPPAGDLSRRRRRTRGLAAWHRRRPQRAPSRLRALRREQPAARPMGVKQWSSKLTPEQRALFARLPQPDVDRASVLSAMAAVRHAFRTEGRARAEHMGATWPVDADDAIAAFWSREGLLTAVDQPGDANR